MNEHRASKKAAGIGQKRKITCRKEAKQATVRGAVVGGKRPRRVYSQSAYYAAKKALARFGQRAVDGRTLLGRALSQWHSALVEDLGGAQAISIQQETIVDLAARTKLLLDSLDAWLLAQPTLINKRKKSALPIVRERQALADSLAKYMTTLGLERKAKPVISLPDYIAGKYGDHEPAKEEAG